MLFIAKEKKGSSFNHDATKQISDCTLYTHLTNEKLLKKKGKKKTKTQNKMKKEYFKEKSQKN